ncbi:MAG: tetratricopeptide repeat protein, partial [Gemmataceae bacterium]
AEQGANAPRSPKRTKNQGADAPRSPIAAEQGANAPRSPRESVAVAPVDLLIQARHEANAGTLDKALQTCQAHLSVVEPSAHAYSLLGVIHQARQEKAEAIACFRRALYLDPQHQEALLHLMLLYQESGNEAAAMRLRQRLERKTAGGKA